VGRGGSAEAASTLQCPYALENIPVYPGALGFPGGMGYPTSPTKTLAGCRGMGLQRCLPVPGDTSPDLCLSPGPILPPAPPSPPQPAPECPGLPPAQTCLGAPRTSFLQPSPPYALLCSQSCSSPAQSGPAGPCRPQGQLSHTRGNLESLLQPLVG
jgi:hypothetical protein